MTKYLISFPSEAMVPEEDFQAVVDASHAVVQRPGSRDARASRF